MIETDEIHTFIGSRTLKYYFFAFLAELQQKFLFIWNKKIKKYRLNTPELTFFTFCPEFDTV